MVRMYKCASGNGNNEDDKVENELNDDNNNDTIRDDNGNLTNNDADNDIMTIMGLTTMTIIMAWMANQKDGNKEEIIEDPKDMSDN